MIWIDFSDVVLDMAVAWHDLCCHVNDGGCRQLVFAHRQGLAEQLKEEQDPAMALHLAAVILFQTFTQVKYHRQGPHSGALQL
jgi:hypothetical protein